jgi:hypothetical protein
MLRQVISGQSPEAFDGMAMLGLDRVPDRRRQLLERKQSQGGRKAATVAHNLGPGACRPVSGIAASSRQPTP